MRCVMRSAWVIILSSVLGACVAAPVQPMSNARQALHAAARSGALCYASARYAAAEHWLDDAEFALRGRDYSRARTSAKRAIRDSHLATAIAARKGGYCTLAP